MRYWLVAVLVLVTFVLQVTVAGFAAIADMAPNLLLALSVSMGLLFGWEVGGGVGLAGGLLIDLTLGRYVGLQGLALGLTGLLAGLMEASVVKDNPALPTLAGALGSLISRCLVFGVLLLFRNAAVVGFAGSLVVGTIYNAVICALLYPLLYRRTGLLHPTPRTFVGRRVEGGVG